MVPVLPHKPRNTPLDPMQSTRVRRRAETATSRPSPLALGALLDFDYLVGQEPVCLAVDGLRGLRA
jgi:hypothetical protein